MSGRSAVWERFSRGVTWSLVGGVSNQGSTLLVYVLVARLCGRETFGEYAVVLATLMAASTATQLALGPTATRFLAELAAADPRRAGRVGGLLAVTSTALAVGVTGILFLIAPWLAARVLAAPQIAGALRLGLGVVLFGAMGGFQTGALAGLEAYRALGVSGIASGTVYVGACAVGARVAGVDGAAVGLSLSAAFQWSVQGLSLMRAARSRGLRWHFDRLLQERAVVLHYALPGALSGLFQLPACWLAMAVLVHQPRGYAEAALLTAALNMRSLTMFLPNTINGVATTLFNDYRGAGDGAGTARSFWTNIAACSAVAFAVGLCVVVTGPALLALYGRGFPAAAMALRVAVGSAVVASVAGAVYQVIGGFERRWVSAWAIAAPSSVTLVAVALWLVPAYQAAGAAAAYLAADVVNLLVTSGVAHRYGVAPRGAVVAPEVGAA